MANPVIFHAPLNGSLAYTDLAGAGTLTGTGAVRYAPGLDPSVWNPALLAVRGSSLAATDRGGAATLTNGGPNRYQPMPGSRINLVPNPSFETNTTGWNSIFNLGGSSSSWARDTTTGKFGSSSAKVTVVGVDVATAYSLFYQNQNAPTTGLCRAVVGQTYTISIYVWADTPGIFTVAPAFAGYDLALGTKGTVNGGAVTITATTPETAQRLTLTGVVPAASEAIRLQFTIRGAVGTASGSVWFDGAQCELGSAATAYFDGSMTSTYPDAAWLDPITGLLGTAHNTTSVEQAGIWVEELTTNILLNPSAESNLNSASASGSCTLTQDSAYAYVGTKSFKIVTDGVAPLEGLVLTATHVVTGAANPYVGQCRVRGTGTVDVWLRANYSDVTLLDGAKTTVVLNDTWQRIIPASITLDPAKTTSNILIMVRTKNTEVATFYVDAAQIEQKAYVTSYCDGSLGTGYAWAGYANASSSTRAATHPLIAEQGHIASKRGAVSLWYRRDYDAGVTAYLVGVGNQSAGTDHLGLYVAGTTDKITQDWRVSPSFAAETAVWGTVDTPGTLYHVYAEWDGPNFAVSVNNGAKVTGTRTWPVTKLDHPSFALSLGASKDGGLQLNGIIGKINIFDQPLTDADRTVLYNGGTPRTDTGFTSVGQTYLREARVNYFLNPSFEVDTSQWAVIGAGAVLTRRTDDAYSGSACLEVKATATGQGLSLTSGSAQTYPFNVTQGTPFTISWYAKWIAGETDWKLEIQQRDAAGAAIASVSTYVHTISSPSWTRYATVFTVNQPGVHRITIRLYRNTTGVESTILVDSFCMEEGLSSAPYFDGSTGGVWLDPITGQIGTAHNSPSASAVAAWVEEGTTNILPNPGAEVDLNSAAASGAGTTLTRDTAYAAVGAASFKLVTPNTAALEGLVLTAPVVLTGAATPYTGQCRVRGSGTVDVWLRANYSDVTITDGPKTTITLTDSWQRVVPASITLDPAKTTSNILLLVRTNVQQGITFWVDAAQVEAKAYATSYADGSLGTGYAWAGYANASSSTRSAGYLSRAASTHAVADRGTLVARANRLIDSGTDQYIHHLYNLSDGRIYLLVSSDAWAGRIGNHAGLSSGVQAHVGVWAVPCVEWDADSYIARELDSGGASADTAYTGNSSVGATGYIGGNGALTSFDGLIGPVMILNRKMTATERAKLAAAPVFVRGRFSDRSGDIIKIGAGTPVAPSMLTAGGD